jgi:hypothetical protein
MATASARIGWALAASAVLAPGCAGGNHREMSYWEAEGHPSRAAAQEPGGPPASRGLGAWLGVRRTGETRDAGPAEPASFWEVAGLTVLVVVLAVVLAAAGLAGQAGAR